MFDRSYQIEESNFSWEFCYASLSNCLQKHMVNGQCLTTMMTNIWRSSWHDILDLVALVWPIRSRVITILQFWLSVGIPSVAAMLVSWGRNLLSCAIHPTWFELTVECWSWPLASKLYSQWSTGLLVVIYFRTVQILVLLCLDINRTRKCWSQALAANSKYRLTLQGKWIIYKCHRFSLNS